MTYRIKNWKKFQHYQNKKPGARLPWIKLYADLLNDVDWHTLPGESAKVLVMLWMVAADADGLLPKIEQLAFRIRMTVQKVNTLLSTLSHWVETDSSDTLEEGYSKSRQEEDKIREEEERRAPPPFVKPFLEDVKAYCLERKCGVDPEKWMSHYEANGWRVGRNPMKDWKAAIRTWEKNEFNGSSKTSKEVPHWSETQIPLKK